MTIKHAVIITLFAGALIGHGTAGADLIGVRTADADRAAGKRLVLVVGRGSAVHDLSMAEVKRLFTGANVSSRGTRLVPFNFPPTSPERAAFDSAALGMSPSEVGRFWVDRKIRGDGTPPRALPSGVYVVKVVAKLPGAISYLPEDQLTSAVQPVKIGGVAYTDPAYPVIVR